MSLEQKRINIGGEQLNADDDDHTYKHSVYICIYVSIYIRALAFEVVKSYKRMHTRGHHMRMKNTSHKRTHEGLFNKTKKRDLTRQTLASTVLAH